MKKWRVAGINFDQLHMEQLLRLVGGDMRAELVGLCDDMPERMAPAASEHGVPADALFTDVDECMTRTRPDLVILCPAAGRRVELVEKIAKYDCAVILDKPFAVSVEQARRMVELLGSERTFVVNWPLGFYPEHRLAKETIDRGVIGNVREVHYFGGNRGPIYVREGDERDATPEEKAQSWWYGIESGGSLMDYLGYGVTLGAWFMDCRLPEDVMTVTDAASPSQVDEHSVTVARFKGGISTYRTRWGTITDPWLIQTQPKSGFIVVGEKGTIASYDYEGGIHVQTRREPQPVWLAADEATVPRLNIVQYMIDCLANGQGVTGPCSAKISLVGQQVMDAAKRSAREGKAVSPKG